MRFPILLALARLYSQSKAGRTGAGGRDFLVDLKKLFAAAGCQDGDARALAMRQLRSLDGQLLRLEGPRRDPDIVHQVRLSPANEAALFQLVGEASPSQRRESLAQQFADASGAPVPARWRAAWKALCAECAQAARSGGPVSPFSRDDLRSNAELLALMPKLLAWSEKGDESLLRFASCVLTGNSKRLGELAAEDETGSRRGKLGLLLERVTTGGLKSLEDVGIFQAPRFALVHGPLRLLLDGEWLNLGLLRGPCRLSETDIARASALESTSCRCLTVENETTFHELAKLQSGELLLCTSYPGSATLRLLERLPSSLEFWHFSDTDPEGFDILRVLRERTGRPFSPLHMNWRPREDSPKLDTADRRLLERLLASQTMRSERETLSAMRAAGRKGDFEQESLGPPTLSQWPFYPVRS